MQKSKKIDMTNGPVIKLIVLFALPICLGNVLQQLYSTVDTLVVGNFCSSASLAAIGTSSQPVEMLLCIFLGIGTGVSILISQYVGSSDSPNLKNTVATSISFYISAQSLYLCSDFLSALLFSSSCRYPMTQWDMLRLI